MKNLFIYLQVIAIALIATACDAIDLEDVRPQNSIPVSAGINDKKTADALLNGVYDGLQDGTVLFDGFLALAQIYSDEAIFTGTFPSRFEFATLNVQTSNGTNAGVFSDFYDVINRANNVIELIPAVQDESFSDADKNSSVAQARFLRALSYFYLINYYGDVPLILSPTRSVAPDVINVPNDPQSIIYDQIIADLQFAEQNLGDGDVLTVTSSAATALLSRVYLYQEDWNNALSSATTVLGTGFDLNAFPYLADQIYGIGFTATDGNVLNFWYSPAECGGRHDVEPSPKFLASYEEGDLRKAASVLEVGEVMSACGLSDTALVPFVLKYDDFASGISGTGTDPLIISRHAELVLIAAEAQARLGNFTEASSWINQVRSRAGLADVTLDASNYMDLILQERLIELSFEGAHRYLDLRRTGRAQAEIQGYQPCHDIWPIPQREIDRNPNLVQNACCNC
ncbi:MAG: RagB/SusD family nutrient uptake outer membrane protein [Bacteroidota bacterium]